MPTGNHGTAELSTKGGANLLAYWDPSQNSAGVHGFILGEDEWDPGYGVYWNPNERPGMGLTVGGSRLGKGAATLIPALLGYSGSCIAIDVKGELAWITAPHRRKLGQHVVILDPFDEVNRAFGKLVDETEITTKYNPLSHIDPDNITFADDVAAIVEALVVHSGKADPYFVGWARELASGLVAAVIQERPGKASLVDVKRILNLSGAQMIIGESEAEGRSEKERSIDEMAAYCQSICKLYPDSLAAEKLKAFSRSTKLTDGAVATLKEQLAFLDSGQLRAFLTSEDGDAVFNFDNFASAPTTVYVVLPNTHLETHGRFLRLVLSNAIRSLLYNRPRLQSPVAIFIDEMPALGPMPLLKTAWGTTSGYGLLLWGFVQDLTQLKEAYPESWESFVSNSALVQLIGCRDTFTSEYFSKYLGNETIITTTSNTGYNSSDSRNSGDNSGRSSPINGTPEQGGNSSEGHSYGRSYSSSNSYGSSSAEMGKPLLDPEQVRKLGSDKLLTIFPGEFSFKIQRFMYFRDPRFFGMYRPDPHYPPPTSKGSMPAPRPNPAEIAKEKARKEAAEAQRIRNQEAANQEAARQRELANQAAEAARQRQEAEKYQRYNATARKQAKWQTLFGVLRLLVIGVAVIAAGYGAYEYVNGDSDKMDRAVQAKRKLPPLPSDLAQAIETRREQEIDKFTKLKMPYKSKLMDVAVRHSSPGEMKIRAIEYCWGGSRGAPSGYRNTTFILTRSSDNAPWSVNMGYGANTFRTEGDVLLLDAQAGEYPDSVE